MENKRHKERKYMINFDWVKELDKDQLASFINIDRPSCNEWCKDAKVGCASWCKHNQGEDIIRKWLDKDTNDYEEI